jgi:hypothetical protein
MRTFDLNIEKILEHWTVADAIREIIANALDEQSLTGTRDVDIFEDERGAWHVRDFGRGLSYEHLTQNENQEKLHSKKPVIGKFGVGLKDALATLHRHGVEIAIRSPHGTITIAMRSKHGFERVQTLHAVIGPPDETIRGTDFELRGVTRATIDEAKRRFLRYSDENVLEKTRYGQVLGRSGGGSGGKARIYIHGVLVAEEEGLLFSYDITELTAPMRKALNRERHNLGRSVYSDRVKQILLACKSAGVANPLVEDLQRFESGEQHDEVGWIDVAVHACKLLNAAEKVVFLTPGELGRFPDAADRARHDGYRIIVISDKVASKIRDARDATGAPVRDLATFEREWNQSFEFRFVEPGQLSPGERRVFETHPDLFRAIGGRPRNVREVVISETMRLEKGFEATGVWLAKEKRIVIKRSELADAARFAGTLLHEAAHATSGATDCTRDFENELTRLLGLLGRACLPA